MAEAVEGLGAACDRIKEHGQNLPVRISCFAKYAYVLAHINTRISEDIQIRELA